MKLLRGFTFAVLFFATSCQPTSSSVTIIDGENIRALQTSERAPLALLAQAGIAPQPNDRVLFNGRAFPIDQALPNAKTIQLQLRRAVTLTLVTPQGQEDFQTSALTVGEALSEVGLNLAKNDLLDPPAETPITQSLTVTYSPARALTILADGKIINAYSSARTVGGALTEAGIPLVGADSSSPSENDALPTDGKISVVRIYETTSVALETIPFTTERIEDANIPFGQEEIIQAGVNGTAMIRTRIRYEDGKEASRATENKTVMREPQKQIVKGGSQISISNLNGMDYWLATEMYATVYSPCASGTGKCSYGTASGARAGYGIVAVDYSIYKYLAGMRVYVPGYGVATIGDTGGGPIIETAFGVPRTKWIDLGFDDGKIVDMTGWVKVYFLAPAPAEIPYFLK
ncbi:MAG: G5 domain-containing protein [Anaerolineales bacterium]|nr:G5 domain-containing protein [Anaerolineales bacterium]